MKRYVLPALLLLAAACGREEEDPALEAAGAAGVQTVVLPSDIQWLNTGIVMRPGTRVHIQPAPSQLDEALGVDEANMRADIPASGSFGLLARVGEHGLPVAVGEGVALQASSHTWGEGVFIGRNGRPSDFSAANGAAEDVTHVAETVLNDLTVILEVEKTTSPAPLAPVMGFFTSNPSPTFDWDDSEDAFKYVFELSMYPDFRDQLLNLEPTASSVSLAALQSDDNSGTPTIPGQSNPSASLGEGVYYWRVRAQVNTCRTIAPCFTWTDHSVVHAFGRETRAALPQPRVLTPAAGDRFNSGEPVLLELTQVPDASGLFWRYQLYHGACGTVINPANAQPKTVSPWYVFRREFRNNFIGDAPQRYAARPLRDLSNGSYVVRLETVDGADGAALDTARAGRRDVAFTVGCN